MLWQIKIRDYRITKDVSHMQLSTEPLFDLFMAKLTFNVIVRTMTSLIPKEIYVLSIGRTFGYFHD